MEQALVVVNLAMAVGILILAYATFQLARTVEQQMQVSHMQANISQSQILEQYRPLLEPRSNFKDGYPFVVRNVGSGVACNVHFLHSSEPDQLGPDTEANWIHVSIAPGEFAEHLLFERQPETGAHLLIKCDDIWGQEHADEFAYYGGSQAWRRLFPFADLVE
jgi:hypothetical protein